MRGKRARQIRAEAHSRYENGERHFDDQTERSFYKRIKARWSRRG